MVSLGHNELNAVARGKFAVDMGRFQYLLNRCQLDPQEFWCHRNGVSNHGHLGSSLNSLVRLTWKKYQCSDYCLFVRGIYQWLVDSPHKGSVMLQTYPCHHKRVVLLLFWRDILWSISNCITKLKLGKLKWFDMVFEYFQNNPDI